MQVTASSDRNDGKTIVRRQKSTARDDSTKSKPKMKAEYLMRSYTVWIANRFLIMETATEHTSQSIQKAVFRQKMEGTGQNPLESGLPL